MHFEDRIEAAKQLVPKLEKYKNATATYILAIPRGSLEMGYELSKTLHLPLDIVVTRKIPAPGNEEYAIGSVAPDGGTLLNEEAVRGYGISPEYINNEKDRLLVEIKRRYKMYRAPADNNIIPSFTGKTVIIIDDGIATGFTMKAAISYLRREKVKKIVVAVPVAAPDTAKEIADMVDEFICLSTPMFFAAVGQFYENFPQVSDEEAANFLKKAADLFKTSQKP
ncbi:phosphoribosyltransferase [Patescibacteria group bacterium]|nr:phosphoribosyltransferase [Patescibacteria group bacterium]MBU1703245.1 phosphoribosyltransferase [Patescibacteria group bacterium]MBU1953775.1 phosphoribosyltransferase [Patescibacteria group bacterium]